MKSRLTGAVCAVAGVFCVMFAAIANAVPVVAVDMDIDTPGIQSERKIAPTDALEVGVVVLGIDLLAPLQAFEFNLGFSSQLTATSVVDGGFLLRPVFVLQEIVAASSVFFAETTLGGGGAVGDGTLGVVAFDPAPAGTYDLVLNSVVLSADFGLPIDVGSLSGGKLTVVPLPSAALLFISGLGWFAVKGMRYKGARSI